MPIVILLRVKSIIGVRFMYQDKIYQNALKESREADFNELKKEVKTVESVIEKFLTQMLECTASISERDFHACGV